MTTSFIISRASDTLSSSKAPHPKAYRKAYVRVDERTASKPENIKSYGGKSDWWYGEGTNHRVENRHIKRDFPAEGWFIDLEWTDLEEFIAKNGGIVIRPYFMNPSILELVIYDYYLE